MQKTGGIRPERELTRDGGRVEDKDSVGFAFCPGEVLILCHKIRTRRMS
jgi:hypothetical protein